MNQFILISFFYSLEYTFFRYLESEPVLYNSEWISAQTRERYFWGNIPGMANIKKLRTENGIVLQDILPKTKIAKKDKTNSITTNLNSMTGKNFYYTGYGTVSEKGIIRQNYHKPIIQDISAVSFK